MPPAVYRSVHSRNISHLGAKQRAKMERRGIVMPVNGFTRSELTMSNGPTLIPEIPTPIA